MSLTGANADKRIPIKPSEEGFYLANLYNLIAKSSGSVLIGGVKPIENKELLSKIAKIY
jgi:molybdopterin-containing oxidoreductase family iron-sulfur binding subunit